MWKDLDTKRDLHMTLITEIDRREQEEANKWAFMASYQPLMEQANEFGRIQLTRDFAKVMWMDEELVNSIYDYPPEYDKAMLDLELLNNDEDVGEITDMNENHKIYIQVYQQALDTKAKANFNCELTAESDGFYAMNDASTEFKYESVSKQLHITRESG